MNALEPHRHDLWKISILDNIDVATKVMQWATESNQDLKVLFFNFQKCYDIVNWKFLKNNYENNGVFNILDLMDIHLIWECNNMHSNKWVKNKGVPNGKGGKTRLSPCPLLLPPCGKCPKCYVSGFNISSTRCNFIGWFNFCETFYLLMRLPSFERN